MVLTLARSGAVARSRSPFAGGVMASSVPWMMSTRNHRRNGDVGFLHAEQEQAVDAVWCAAASARATVPPNPCPPIQVFSMPTWSMTASTSSTRSSSEMSPAAAAVTDPQHVKARLLGEVVPDDTEHVGREAVLLDQYELDGTVALVDEGNGAAVGLEDLGVGRRRQSPCAVGVGRNKPSRVVARPEGAQAAERRALYVPFQPDVGSPISESGVEGPSPFPCFVGGHLCQLSATRAPKIVRPLKHRGAQAL